MTLKLKKLREKGATNCDHGQLEEYNEYSPHITKI